MKGPDRHGVVVVGGGLAAFSTARALRDQGFAGRIVLIDPAPLPYDRPPLSKGFLAGKVSKTDLLLAPESWYEDNAVRVVADIADGLEPSSGAVRLRSGARLAADHVVLATGSRARPLPIPGRALDGVHSLRSLADATLLANSLEPGRRLVIIGAGLVGAETASTAVSRGVDVTLVDPAKIPLVSALGPVVARHLQEMHASAGVRTISGAPTAIRKVGGDLSVELSDGQILITDDVLIAIGGEPITSLAESAGLTVDDGILVDSSQRTSNAAVFAVGDVARTRDLHTDGKPRRRVEHWEAAKRSGERAAAAITGTPTGPPPSSWFWSDRYGVHVEAFGDLCTASGRTVVRDEPAGSLAVLQLSPTGRLVGAAAVDSGITVRAAQRLAEKGAPLDPAALADPRTNLRALARQRDVK